MRAWIVLLLLVTGLAGCSGETKEDAPVDVPEGPGPPVEQNETELPTFAVEVALSGAYPANIAYDPARIEVPVGTLVTVTFTNTDQNTLVNHDWVLEGVEGAATEVIGNGESSSVTFEAPAAGEYTFYCSVPGHRGNGMEGTLVVG